MSKSIHTIDSRENMELLTVAAFSAYSPTRCTP